MNFYNIILNEMEEIGACFEESLQQLVAGLWAEPFERGKGWSL